jgi:glycosyltransferase involved in cell wall biosynthesis
VKKDIQFNLIIIGYGVNKSLIQKKIKNFNLEKSVKILGYKSNPYPYLRASDLFILTSKYEGLPNVILEAQVLKKYVISSDCPTGPKEILLNGKTGTLFKVGDYKQLAIEIKNFYYNRNKMRKKIKKAFQMLHRFDFEKNCYRYLYLVNKYI